MNSFNDDINENMIGHTAVSDIESSLELVPEMRLKVNVNYEMGQGRLNLLISFNSIDKANGVAALSLWTSKQKQNRTLAYMCGSVLTMDGSGVGRVGDAMRERWIGMKYRYGYSIYPSPLDGTKTRYLCQKKPL